MTILARMKITAPMISKTPRMMGANIYGGKGRDIVLDPPPDKHDT